MSGGWFTEAITISQVSKEQGVSEEPAALPSKSVASIQGESRLSNYRAGDGVCYYEADMLHVHISFLSTSSLKRGFDTARPQFITSPLRVTFIASDDVHDMFMRKHRG